MICAAFTSPLVGEVAPKGRVRGDDANLSEEEILTDFNKILQSIPPHPDASRPTSPSGREVKLRLSLDGRGRRPQGGG